MEEREHDEEGPPFAVASDWVRKQAARCTLHVRCTLAVPSFFQLFIIILFFYLLNPPATAAPAWMHTVL
jgi:hypothetical protein